MTPLLLAMRQASRLLVVGFLGLLLASCGSREKESDLAAQQGILLMGNGSEPKGLDPALQTGVPENRIISALLEGLIAYHPTNDLEPEPGIAESWEHNADNTVWTFKLRDAKWTNGDAVTAQDFVYSWQRMLSPALGSEYAEMLYVLQNGEQFHNGSLKDFGQVGVKALDPKTLQVTLAGPTPYFLNMLKHYSWYPVNPKTVDKFGGMTDRQSGWSTLDNYVGNGPFKLKKWVTNQIIEVERNPSYWDAKTVKLNGIRFFPVDNVGTEETMYRSGRLHLTSTINPDKIATFKRDMPDQMTITPYLGSYFYRLNVTRKPFDDPRVRKALALAIDKQLLVDKVTQGGQAPATGFVPAGIPGFAPYTGVKYDPEAAKRLLAEAGYPGGKGFPKKEILINTSELHRKVAEAIQAMWRQTLGIDVGIYNQEWKVFLDSQSKLDYDISRSGWIGDYVYPTTFLNIFTKGNGNNDTGWSNPKFDALIDQARASGNEEERFGLLRQAEEILMDELPVLPIYWYTRTYLKSPLVEGWNSTLLDNHPYKYVSLKGQK